MLVKSEFRSANSEYHYSFGDSVFASDLGLFIGSPQTNNSIDRTGAVFLYGRNSSTLAQLIVPTKDQISFMGSCVSSFGDDLVVGAFGSYYKSGALLMYARNGTTWNGFGEISGIDAAVGDNFGFDCILTNDSIIVSAPYGGVYGDGYATGTVQVFDRSGGPLQKLYPASRNENIAAQFGYSIGISDDLLVVGSPNDDNYGGACFVFQKIGNNWLEVHKVKPQNLTTSSEFGYSVSILGELLAVGSPGESSVYVFSQVSSNSWQLKLQVKYPLELRFGTYVLLNDTLLLVGSHFGNYVNVMKRSNKFSIDFIPFQNLTLSNVSDPGFGSKIVVHSNSIFISHPSYGSVFEFQEECQTTSSPLLTSSEFTTSEITSSLVTTLHLSTSPVTSSPLSTSPATSSPLSTSAITSPLTLDQLTSSYPSGFTSGIADEESPSAKNAEVDKSGYRSLVWIVVGSVAGGLLLLLLVAVMMISYKRQHSKLDEGNIEPIEQPVKNYTPFSQILTQPIQISPYASSDFQEQPVQKKQHTEELELKSSEDCEINALDLKIGEKIGEGKYALLKVRLRGIWCSI